MERERAMWLKGSRADSGDTNRYWHTGEDSADSRHGWCFVKIKMMGWVPMIDGVLLLCRSNMPGRWQPADVANS